MLDEGTGDGAARPKAASASRQPAGLRRLDGAIEWHPPRLAKRLLKRLDSASTWVDAALVLADSIGEAIGAASSQISIAGFDESNGGGPGTRNGSTRVRPLEASSAEWLGSPGVRRIERREAREDSILRHVLGEVPTGGCGLLLTTDPEMVPTTCIAWVLEDEERLPEWVGRVLSEFAVGVPSWWTLLETVREQSTRLESIEKDRHIAVACRGLLHDLDNALFPIRCRLDLLFSPRRSADELRHLEAISASIEQLKQLGRDLRSQVDRTGSAPAPTNLAAWWKAQRPAIAAALPSHATIAGAISDSLPPIVMPEATLTQIVVNLAVNAGKALGAEGAVFVSAREAEHRRIRLTVSDNGAGIPAKSLEALRRKIRDRRAEGLPVDGSGGRRHGFGLAIVEELVDRWGGTLEIESTPGEGTRVGIVVPAASQDRSEAKCAIVEVGDARRRWVIAEMLRCLGVQAMTREDVVAGPEDGRLGDHSIDHGDREQESRNGPTIWIADGSHADSDSLLGWLDADEDRLAIAIGETAATHARLRRIDALCEDAETLAALRRVFEPKMRFDGQIE